MRNTLFAAAAAFALILGTAPTFAAESNATQAPAAPPAAQHQQGEDTGGSGGVQPQAQQSDSAKGNCAELMANKSVKHTDAEKAACQGQ